MFSSKGSHCLFDRNTRNTNRFKGNVGIRAWNIYMWVSYTERLGGYILFLYLWKKISKKNPPPPQKKKKQKKIWLSVKDSKKFQILTFRELKKINSCHFNHFQKRRGTVALAGMLTQHESFDNNYGYLPSESIVNKNHSWSTIPFLILFVFKGIKVSKFLTLCWDRESWEWGRGGTGEVRW